MSTNSQFLYTFTDEFSTSEWVEWSEGVLAELPDVKFHNKTGFQRAVGSTGSGPRTRANEAYRSGYLRAPLVDSRFSKKHPLPLGWLAIINGNAPHSTLGFYAYIIGRALQLNKNSALFKSALNDIAAIQILHIGFRRENRWFSTVALFEYVRGNFENQVKRDATHDELPYLAAAMINTVEGSTFDNFLTVYKEGKKIETLSFTLENDKAVPVKLSEIPSIADSYSFDLETIKRKRAHRYWAKPERGIYSRAASAKGKAFLAEFAKAEHERFVSGNLSAMSSIYESIAAGDIAEDIIELAPELFSGFDELLNSWQELNAHLRSATRSTIKSADFKGSPSQWKLAQKAIFGPGDILITDQELMGIQQQIGGTETKPTKKIKKKSAKKEPSLPNSDEIAELMAKTEDLFVQAPKEKKKKGKKKSGVQQVQSGSDRADRDQRNSKLGLSGEEFVCLSEKRKLQALGLDELAGNILWASKEIGDGLGYDILSYDENGNEIFIEVKTTRGGIGTPFFISKNEVEVSIEKGASYKVHRLFNYPKAPSIYVVDGPLDKALVLTPTSFRAMPK